MTYDERNKAIARAIKSGSTRAEQARKYGLTPRRIGQIAASLGVHRYHEEQVAMGLLNRGGAPRDPKLARLNADEMRAYVKARRYYGAAYARNLLGLRGVGRKPVFMTDPDKRRDYLALRDAYGAAYAREAMGLAA